MKRTLSFVRPSKAFTLIELMIVIVIIGILAVALLPRVIGAPAKARDVTRKTDIADIINALELYAADVGSYPLGGATPTNTCLTGADAVALLIDDYLQEFPTDPTGLSSQSGCSGYYYVPLTQSGTGSSATNYALIANLEGVVTAAADDIFCTSGETSYPSVSSMTSYTAAETYLDTACGTNTNAFYVVLK